MLPVQGVELQYRFWVDIDHKSPRYSGATVLITAVASATQDALDVLVHTILGGEAVDVATGKRIPAKGIEWYTIHKWAWSPA